MAFLTNGIVQAERRSTISRCFRRQLPLLLLAQVFTCCLPAFAQKPEVPPLEYQIKASLIFNFLQYVEWPTEISEAPEIQICIAGQNPFGVALTPLEREVVHGRKLTIKYLVSSALDDLRHCQVVFFGPEASEQLLLAELKGSSILTIGETKEFLDNGGVISMQIESNKVVFDINRKAALEGRLVISSKLLRIARRVEDEG